MRNMVRAEILPPRTLSRRVTERGGIFLPWVEVSAQVVVRVASWGREEAGWVHWAVPVVDGKIVIDRVRACDPGLRAGRLGGPDGLAVGTREEPSESEIREAAAALWSRCRLEVHRLGDSGPVSRIGEPRDVFRRRCLALLRPSHAREVSAGSRGAGTLASLAASIETITPGPDELEVRRLEARVVWYPPGQEPSLAVDRVTVPSPQRQRAGS
ncbi:MAG: hypothetical protein ACM3O7_09625 [Acidobacteriota bacterium]